MKKILIIYISVFLSSIILVFLLLSYLPLFVKEPSSNSVASINVLVKNSEKKEVSFLTKEVMLGTFVLKDGNISDWKICNPKKDKNNCNDEAHLYFLGKRLSSVHIRYGILIGEYYCSICYYYRQDGSLAYISQEHPTFSAGNVTINSKVYFNLNGDKIKESIEYFNFDTHKPVEQSDSMPDREPEVYKTTKEILAKFTKDLKGVVPPWTTFK